ncbi:MAG: hypothetical protein ACRC4W_03350 [Treponemataceae bacterium]
MKKLLSMLLIILLAVTGAFAWVEEYWGVEDIEDMIFVGNYLGFDSKFGNPGIAFNYAQDNFSVYTGIHGLKLKLSDGADSTYNFGGTLGASYRSEMVRIGALLNFTGKGETIKEKGLLGKETTTRTDSKLLGVAVAGSFVKDMFRFALPMYVDFKANGDTAVAISTAYVKAMIFKGPLQYMRLRTRYNTGWGDGIPGYVVEGQKNLEFDLDAMFYNDLGDRFGAECLVRLIYKTTVANDTEFNPNYLGIYIEPYIFGYTEGNVMQLGLVPFATVGGEFSETKSFGIDEWGVEIRLEFQPIEQLRARVSVQTYNNGDWGVKWNARAAWYY